jgi:hypothetical protein
MWFSALNKPIDQVIFQSVIEVKYTNPTWHVASQLPVVLCRALERHGRTRNEFVIVGVDHDMWHLVFLFDFFVFRRVRLRLQQSTVQYNVQILWHILYTTYPSFHGILTHNSRTVRSCISCRNRLVKATVSRVRKTKHSTVRARKNECVCFNGADTMKENKWCW